MENVIPKIIHYCWFGRNPLPKSAKKCIASWKKYLPDYEIKEWNEDNFDVNIIPYTRDAYEAKKYAFVSDFARFWVLFKFGGLYFDTDVEVIRPMDDLVGKGAFMGWETANQDGVQKVAPGLGLCAPIGHPLYKEILVRYENLTFYDLNGVINKYTMIPLVTEILENYGLRLDGTKQQVAETTIFPAEYFCPMNNITGDLLVAENTFSIHWYSMSWISKKSQWRLKLGRWYRRLGGFISS